MHLSELHDDSSSCSADYPATAILSRKFAVNKKKKQDWKGAEGKNDDMLSISSFDKMAFLKDVCGWTTSSTWFVMCFSETGDFWSIAQLSKFQALTIQLYDSVALVLQVQP